jgi:signal transduction histidine kinase
MRLASKFIALLVIGVLVLVATDGYLTARREIDMFDGDMRRDARELSSDLLPMIAHVWKTGGHDNVIKLIDEANKARTLPHIRWVWLDASPDDPHGPKVAQTQLIPITAKKVVSIKHFDADGNEHLLTYARMTLGGARPAALELTEPVTHSREMMRLFVVRMIVLSTITLLLGVGLVILLGAELVGKPLKLLIDKTRRIGRGDLSGPVSLRRRDEFGELATAINSMCEQLLDAQNKVNEETAARIAALEQLRHADRLRTVGRLASGIAHELGTPLNVVGGRAGMIASGKLSDDETKKSADIIKQESDRITSIIRQLLDFARRSSPKRTSVDLSALVDETVEFLEPLAEKRGVSIERTGSQESFVCNVDAAQIRQVLTNLMVNGAQAMPDGGRVEVSIRRQQVRPPEDESAAERPYLAVSIQDQGSGIAEEDMEQLFEPFFTTKDIGEGTGLGLSIAYGIIQEHGGWIDVQSELGQGSCFTVYLPTD